MFECSLCGNSIRIHEIRQFGQVMTCPHCYDTCVSGWQPHKHVADETELKIEWIAYPKPDSDGICRIGNLYFRPGRNHRGIWSDKRENLKGSVL